MYCVCVMCNVYGYSFVLSYDFPRSEEVGVRG